MRVNFCGIPALPAEPAPCSAGRETLSLPRRERGLTGCTFPSSLFPGTCVRLEARCLWRCENLCQKGGLLRSERLLSSRGAFPRSRLDLPLPVFGTSLSQRRRWERQRVSSLLHRAGMAFASGSVAPGDS